jgi:HEAT repeat protein
MATFREKLRDAGKGEEPSAASLTFMSDLSSEDRATLREMWPGLETKRRRYIVGELVTIAEDNIELDFRHVFLVALEDTDAEVRLLAIDGLFEDNSKLLLGRLLHILGSDPDSRVREAAASALGRFTYLAQCDKIAQPQAGALREGLLQSARDDKETDVRRRSIEALGYFHGDAEVQDLIANAYKQGGRHAESALFAMGRSMDARWEPIVLDELKSDKSSIRYEAAHAAGEMVLEDALPELARIIDDRDIEVRLAAVWALGQIGGKPAANALVRALQSPEPALREAAQEAMGEVAFSANPLSIV